MDSADRDIFLPSSGGHINKLVEALVVLIGETMDHTTPNATISIKQKPCNLPGCSNDLHSAHKMGLVTTNMDAFKATVRPILRVVKEVKRHFAKELEMQMEERNTRAL